MLLHSELNRMRRLIDAALVDFSLRLDGARVLTEVASGFFVSTSLIAAMAGATVDAVAKDSSYGKAADIICLAKGIAKDWGISDNMRFYEGVPPSAISEADIVTNLGFVRPIDKTIIDRLKLSAVIPLMWETWEYRKDDLDLKACRERGIAVMGTNERDERVRTFEYVGMLVQKILLQEGLEIIGNSVVLIGSGTFVDTTKGFLNASGAIVHALAHDVNSATASNAILMADAVVVIEHSNPVLLIGENGVISRDPELWNGKKVIHVCGQIDAEWLKRNGAHLLPDDPASFGRMSYTTAHLGPMPVIRLHAAGLKVGEAMWRARMDGLKGHRFIAEVLRSSPAMAFEDDIAE